MIDRGDETQYSPVLENIVSFTSIYVFPYKLFYLLILDIIDKEAVCITPISIQTIIDTAAQSL